MERSRTRRVPSRVIGRPDFTPYHTSGFGAAATPARERLTGCTRTQFSNDA